MYTRLNSLGVWGLNGYIVGVEVDVSGGLPQFSIVGLPDNAVKEAADRVRSALKNIGFKTPIGRVTINLAPADTRKSGSVYDLPILLGVLAADRQIEELPNDSAFIGELSLGGEIRPVGGVLPMALACEKQGIKKLFLPAKNAREAAVVQGLEVYPLENSKQLLRHMSGDQIIQPVACTPLTVETQSAGYPDFSDVYGQPEARRAIEIAAVGLHNIILVGPPGTGKSMLAKRLPGILPPMNRSEAMETSQIYSVAVRQEGQDALVAVRPFRSPHHSVSAAGLAGGGSTPQPGEISLAHNGVLFLDELPEFNRETLEMLRQPLEEGTVTLSRVAGTATYPSRFMLVAAMNPCPCGFFGHPTRECRCASHAIERYLQRISGPLLDRIDLHVEVQPVEYEQISAKSGGEQSRAILERVCKAREFQVQRTGMTEPPANSGLAGDQLRQDCPMTELAQQRMKSAFDRLGLSARGYDRVLRVCRSIADLEAQPVIQAEHVAEAVQYRNLDRKYFYSQ